MSAFVAEVNKLRNIQQHLEKNENIFAEQIGKIDESSFELYNDITNSRALQVEKLQDDVRNIIVPLRKVNNVIHRENIAKIDIKAVKKDMTVIQNNIQSIKCNNKTALDSLQKEEEKLVEDMQAFEQKIEDWTKPLNSLYKKYVAKRTSAATPENISEEAKAFMEYVTANGGHENGWAADDHNLFLKTKAKTKNVEKLAEILHAILPDISEEEIFAHDKWYQKYTELKEKQKDSIKNWRNDKSKSKTNTSVGVVTQNSSERNLLKTHSYYLNKEEMQKKINAWKTEKRTQTKEERERKLHLELKQQEIMEKQRKQRHKQIRVEVNNWRHLRKAEKEADRTKKVELELRNRENKAARANKLIKQFQSQDEVFVQRKLEMRQARPRSAELEVAKPNYEVARDPDRLLRPTRQWIMRTYGGGKSEPINKLPVQAIPKLGIPEWRRSVL